MDDGDVAALRAEILDRQPPYPMVYRAGYFGERCSMYLGAVVPADAAQLDSLLPTDLMVHFWMGSTSRHNRDFVADEDWICTQITSVAGTDIVLENTLSIFTRPRLDMDTSPNSALLYESRGECVWFGPVLVVKHSRTQAVTNIASTDCSLLKLAVIRALKSGVVSQNP